MKKSIIATIVLLSAFMLSAAEKEFNPVWEDKGTRTEFKTYAFGFSENSKEYNFAFQIKDLQNLMDDKDAMIVCYFDTDNNKNTGRFKKKKGWDLQLNILLNRRSLSAIVWEDNKIQTSHTFGEGEFSIDAEDDILFLTVNKVLYLKKIKFGKKFVLFEELTCGKKVVKSGLEDGITINVK
ncbi:MAG: hypothetical protein IKC08_10755 [Lentisphaeria bacterium]|nr:hypothetical protein [Lentisphaeria bacterium]